MSAIQPPTKYVEEPTGSLLCPVCKMVFQEPIISVKCGHTFCRECIEDMNKDGRTCPLDDQKCDSGQLVLNRAIMGQLEELLIYCCHGIRPLSPAQNSYERDSEGCPEVICVGERAKHEDDCSFAWAECPIGKKSCGPIRKKSLENHKTLCTRIPCPFTDFGCVFTGSRVEVAEHDGSCLFREETQLMAITMKELKVLKVSNEGLHASLGRATKAIEKLTTERGTMTIQLEQQALTITSLTSRMDQLETDLESYKSTRLRHSRRNIGEVTPRSNRRDRNSTNENKRWSNESMTSLQETRRGHGTFRWEMPFTVKCIGTFRGHKGTIWSVVASGGHLFSGSSDGSIKIWDTLDLRRGCLKTVSAHKDGVLCMSMGSGILYSAGSDLSIRSWHLNSMEEIGFIQKAHEGVACAMTCSREYIFTSFYGCIKIWDVVSLKEIHKMESVCQSWIRALAYDKRKDLLYSCSSNRIHEWRCYGDFSLVREFDTQYGSLYSLATTNKYIITGTHSQNIQVYNINSLEHLHTLSGHIGRVTVLNVTDSSQGDREYMFSGSSDSTVTVWDLENMLPILTLQRHEKAVHTLAVLHDSVFSGSEDMEIKVFRHFKL